MAGEEEEKGKDAKEEEVKEVAAEPDKVSRPVILSWICRLGNHFNIMQHVPT